MDTKIACMFFDKSEYKDEIKDIKQLSRRLAGQRGNLEFGMLTDTKVIKKLKKQHPNYFPEVGYSSCVLKRYDG